VKETSISGALGRCRSKRPLSVQWCALIGISAALLTGCGSSSGAGSSSAVVTSPPTIERDLIQPGTMLSGAAVYGDLVWTAGHLPEGVAAAAPIEEQIEQVLDNLERTLQSANAGFDTLLKTNVYLLDWGDWEAFNEIYEARIGRPYMAPPRTTVDVDELGLGYRIEIEMVAYVRAS
jgi:2-iminobutanoate/2-iminopropanoate deaminase